jgi:hypothetical protein
MRLTESPKTLADMRPDVVWPRRLQAVMDKALARDAIQRYQHAADFGREFAMAIDAMPSHDPTEVGTVVIDASGKKTPIPRTRVDGTPEPEIIRKEPAGTPVARKNAAAMLGIGGFVVVALGGFIAFKAGLIGGGSAPSPSVTHDTSTTPPVAPSGPTGAQTPPQQQQQQQQRGGSGVVGGTGAVTPPPVTPPTGGTGAVNNPPPASRMIDSVTLDRLAKWADDAADPTIAQRTIKSADSLLATARGEQRVEVLLRRGTAKFFLSNDAGGCKDLLDALDAAGPSSSFLRPLNALIANQDCKKS